MSKFPHRVKHVHRSHWSTFFQKKKGNYICILLWFCVDSIQHITNLTGGDTRDGYDTHAIRTRVDRGSEFSLRATHHWGSKDIGIKHTRLIHWLRQGGAISRCFYNGMGMEMPDSPFHCRDQPIRSTHRALISMTPHPRRQHHT